MLTKLRASTKAIFLKRGLKLPSSGRLQRTHKRTLSRRLLLESLEVREVFATFSVTNTDSSGAGSLQLAILSANATSAADTIRFDIPGASLHTIQGALPAISSPLTIDGTSQPGYAANLGKPLIELKGNGLLLEASNCKITGLAINDSLGYGIAIGGPGRNVIQGNYIGTDATGEIRKGNYRGGIYVAAGANDNIIGTDGNGVNDTAEGNLISGNGFVNRRVPTGGIEIDGSHRNIIAGNLIGTDALGLSPIYNASYGVSIVNGGQLNRVGTNGNGISDELERNVITGVIASVHLADFGTNNNVVAGNLIGTDVTGTHAFGGSTGVELWIGADHNRVGTDANGRSDSLERNLISGNVSTGVDVQGDSNTIAGNYIGTDITGSVALPNGVGVQVTGWLTTIGGTKAAARNVISGNFNEGVLLSADSPKVQGNYIGVDTTGTAAIPNSYGVVANYAPNLLIGGTAAGARNIISGNVNDGISIYYVNGPGAIQGNYIGTNALGTAALGNGTPGDFPVGHGIDVFASSGLVIGGSTANTRNVISGNVLDGIAIESTSSDNSISGNYIGTNAAGTLAISNHGPGIFLTGQVINTTIGGTAAGYRNLISGNTVGIHLESSSNNSIQGNYIGTDKTGKLPIGNASEGILLDWGSTNNIIGSHAVPSSIPVVLANIIAYNGAAGIAISDAESVGNTIRGNSIFGNGGLGISQPLAMLSPPTLGKVIFGVTTHVQGTFQGAANTTYTLDFYASPSALTSGEGQGKRYLTSLTFKTDATGLASFNLALSVRTTASEWVTAIATDPLGTSSAFSNSARSVRI